MGSCPKTKAYLLSEDLSVDAKSHLEQCEVCRRELEKWQQVKASLDQWDPSFGHFVTQNEKTISLMQEARRRKNSLLNQPKNMLIAGTAVAASIAVVIGIVILLSFPKGTHESEQSTVLKPFTLTTVISRDASVTNVAGSPVKTVSTQEGGQLIVEMEGDRFGLDSSSNALISKSESNEVNVTLIRGTVVVSARKRLPGQSLVVKARDTKVRVTGTRFLVALLPDSQVQVNVVEGTVRIDSPSEENLLLSKGDSYRAVNRRGEVASLSKEDGSRVETLLAPAPKEINPTPHVEEEHASTLDSNKESGEKRKLRRVTARHLGLSEARSLILDGKTDQAQAALQQLLVGSPKNVEAWMLLATSWRKMGKWREAASAFDEATIHGNQSEANRARFMSAVVYQDKLGDQKRACSLLEQYLRDQSGNKPLEPKALLRLVRAKVALRDNAGANKAYSELESRYAGTKEAEQAAKLIN